MRKVTINIKFAFALTVLLVAVFTIVDNMPSHAQGAGRGCRVSVNYAPRSNGSYLTFTSIQNTGDSRLYFSTLSWNQDYVTDVARPSIISATDYRNGRVFAKLRNPVILEPGEQYLMFGMHVYQDGVDGPDSSSFKINGLRCNR